MLAEATAPLVISLLKKASRDRQEIGRVQVATGFARRCSSNKQWRPKATASGTRAQTKIFSVTRSLALQALMTRENCG